MTPQELIDTLISQHRLLQKYLTSELNLELFKITLDEHLKLEDEQFYPRYMELKKKRGEDLTPTLEFINQMKEIGEKVRYFLENYSEKDTEELSKVVDTLNLRIETEEEGVYGVFLAMN